MYFLNKFRGTSFISALSIVASFFVGSGLIYVIIEQFIKLFNEGKIGDALFCMVYFPSLIAFTSLFLLIFCTNLKIKLFDDLLKNIIFIFGVVSFLSFFVWSFYIIGSWTYDAFANGYGLGWILFSCGASIFGFMGLIYLAVFIVKKFTSIDEILIEIMKKY